MIKKCGEVFQITPPTTLLYPLLFSLLSPSVAFPPLRLRVPRTPPDVASPSASSVGPPHGHRRSSWSSSLSISVRQGLLAASLRGSWEDVHGFLAASDGRQDTTEGARSRSRQVQNQGSVSVTEPGRHKPWNRMEGIGAGLLAKLTHHFS